MPRAHAAGGAKTVLAFPVSDESEGATLEEAASRLTSALALAGRDTVQVDLEVFSAASPMTRRAIADGSLRSADIEGIIDAPTALLIGQAFGVDTVVLVGAQSLTVKGDPRTAELAVMGTEYDVAANVDAETGAIVAEPRGTTFGVSGLAKGRTAKADEDGTLLRGAARDAAYKIMHVLSGRSAEDYVERGAEPKKRSNMWRYLAALLVIGGIIAATSRGGDDGGPVPTDDTLPTRCTARPSADGIRLSWLAPSTTTRVLFKYQIQRSADGGFFARIDNDNVGPTATSFSDFNIVRGTAYVYQIRALFTDGFTSQWATFNQVVAP
jgi:hypothetical protein